MMFALVWTFDHDVELATLVVGAIAAIFAIRSNANTKRAAAAETTRWKSDIRPAPFLNFDVRDVSTVNVRNAGGAVQPGYIVAVNGSNLWYCTYSLGAHQTTTDPIGLQVLTQLTAPYQTRPGDTRTVVHWARDVDGNWWDILNGGTINDAFPEPATDAFYIWAEPKWRAALGM
jgi:hypothetical protein